MQIANDGAWMKVLGYLLLIVSNILCNNMASGACSYNINVKNYKHRNTEYAYNLVRTALHCKH